MAVMKNQWKILSGVILISLITLFFIGCGEPNSPVGGGSFYTILGTIDPYSFPQDAAFNGDTLLVAERFDGIGVYDISSPSSPVEIDRLPMDTGVRARRIAVAAPSPFDVFLVLASTDTVTVPVNPVYHLADLQLSTYTAPFGTKLDMDFKVRKDSVRLDWNNQTEYTDVLQFVLADPGMDDAIQKLIYFPDKVETAPNVYMDIIASRITHSAVMWNNTVANRVAIIGDGDYVAAGFGEFGIAILDIKGTEAPSPHSLVSSIDTHGEIRGLDCEGNYLYVAEGVRGISVIDISDLANPVIADEWKISGMDHAIGVIAYNKWLAVRDDLDGVYFFDISVPSSPSFQGIFEVRGPRSVQFDPGSGVNGKPAVVAISSEEMGVIILQLSF